MSKRSTTSRARNGTETTEQTPNPTLTISITKGRSESNGSIEPQNGKQRAWHGKDRNDAKTRSLQRTPASFAMARLRSSNSMASREDSGDV